MLDICRVFVLVRAKGDTRMYIVSTYEWERNEIEQFDPINKNIKCIVTSLGISYPLMSCYLCNIEHV